MRPGNLAGTDYWFGNLDGEYFEIRESHSARPLYRYKDRVSGKTGIELKARIPHIWSSTLITKKPFWEQYLRKIYLS